MNYVRGGCLFCWTHLCNSNSVYLKALFACCMSSSVFMIVCTGICVRAHIACESPLLVWQPAAVSDAWLAGQLGAPPPRSATEPQEAGGGERWANKMIHFPPMGPASCCQHIKLLWEALLCHWCSSIKGEKGDLIAEGKELADPTGLDINLLIYRQQSDTQDVFHINI